VKWWIDPGLDGDVQADKPYLYGALLSSINVLRIGSKDEKALENTKDDEADVLTEGADGDGEAARKELAIPDAAHARQKHFLTEQHRKDFEFEKGREYKCDFFNPYLDFNEFSLKLGYGLPPISIMGHWDGQPLRYVLFPSFPVPFSPSPYLHLLPLLLLLVSHLALLRARSARILDANIRGKI
jgi:hypothetical protein